MANMHLFSTPVECTHCGTVVEDPTTDHCPSCNHLLKERRTPARLAGVERKYKHLRLLLGALRFLGVISAVVGLLVFLFSSGDLAWPDRVLALFGSLVVAVAVFAVAALLDIALDVEENTRASFRVQQKLLDELQQRRTPSV